MASPPSSSSSPEWQVLAKIKPKDIIFSHKDDVERYEDLGSNFANVRTSHAYDPHIYATENLFQINLSELTSIDDLRHASQLGQQFTRVRIALVKPSAFGRVVSVSSSFKLRTMKFFRS